MKFRHITQALAGCAAALLLLQATLSAAEEIDGYPGKLVLHTQGPGPKEERLRVPIAVYQDAQGRRVDLIGAIHLADGAYYRRLNRRFKSYDKLLYEMVNGEHLSEMLWLRKKASKGELTPDERKRLSTLEAECDEAADSSVVMGLLHYYYDFMSAKMGFTMQADGIDYGQPNFVYADMSQEEFEAAMAEGGESWMGYFIDALAESFKNGEILAGSALDASSPVAMRRYLMKIMAKSMESLPMDDKAIVVARNIRCMEVLDRELADPAVRKVGIFYGAAHLRDMDARLRERGFELQSVEWMTAWKVGSKLK